MPKRGVPLAGRGAEKFAEELGRMLTAAQTRAEDWLGQRRQIAKTLESIRDTATKLLHQLERDMRSTQHRGQPSGSGSDPGRASHVRVMSAEARERIRQAQLKRWAKHRAAAKKK